MPKHSTNILHAVIVFALMFVALQKYYSINNSFLQAPQHVGANCSLGASLGSLISRKLEVNFFIDYNLMAPPSYSNGEYNSTIGLGARSAYRF